MQDVLQHLQLRSLETLVLQCTAAALEEGGKSGLQVHLLRNVYIAVLEVT